MAWFNYIKYDVHDSEATYLFCYLLFNCNATQEEKKELIQVRDENGGDNHMALDIMYQRLYNRQIEEERKQLEHEDFKIKQKTELDCLPYKEERKQELLRWHGRNMSMNEIQKRTTYKNIKKFTAEEFEEMLKQPIIKNVKVSEDLNYDILDKYCGAYTVIFNDGFRFDLPKFDNLSSSVTKQFVRAQFIDQIEPLYNIKIHDIQVEIKHDKERKQKLKAERDKLMNTPNELLNERDRRRKNNIYAEEHGFCFRF